LSILTTLLLGMIIVSIIGGGFSAAYLFNSQVNSFVSMIPFLGPIMTGSATAFLIVFILGFLLTTILSIAVVAHLFKGSN